MPAPALRVPMRPAAVAAALAALLLPALLAGCIQGGPHVTARDALAIGEAAARAWRADAQLAGAIAREQPTVTLDATNASFPDGAVGDGHAPAWVLQFVAASAPDEGYVVIALANGTILHQERFPLRQSSDEGVVNVTTALRLYPVRDWRVDSGEAASIAARNATWAAIRPNARAAEFRLFGGNGTDPVWVAGITTRPADSDGDADGGDTAVAFINATTGAVLDRPPAWLAELVDVDVGFGGPGGSIVEAEEGAFDGTLTLVQREAAHTFDIGQGHPSLEVRVRFAAPSPGHAIDVTLTAPDGQVLEGTVAEQEAAFDLPRPPAGEYRVDLALAGAAAGGVAARYQGCWRAAGTFDVDIPSPFRGPC